MKLRYEVEKRSEKIGTGNVYLLYSSTSLNFQSSTEHPHQSLSLTRAELLLGEHFGKERA